MPRRAALQRELPLLPGNADTEPNLNNFVGSLQRKLTYNLCKPVSVCRGVGSILIYYHLQFRYPSSIQMS
jgi:hypothetical protein